jgi:hypothetical protein
MTARNQQTSAVMSSEVETSPVRVDMWDQEVGTPGTVGHAIRSYTTQWGLPDMACGHNFSQLIEKSDGRIVCGACGK